MANLDFLTSGIYDKTLTWMQIIKSLPYKGGASTSAWVYLRTAEVVALCELLFAGVSSWVYLKTGHMDASMMALHLGVIGALFGFASNTKNQAQTLNAQLQSGATPTGAASTPLSTESEAKPQ